MTDSSVIQRKGNMKKGISMNTQRKIGDEIVQSMQEAVDYMRGKNTHAIIRKIKIPDKTDVNLFHSHKVVQEK